MSADSDSAEKLLAAASQTVDRTMRVIYCAEARILISRERERIRQQALLLDAMEAAIVCDAAPSQLPIASVRGST